MHKMLIEVYESKSLISIRQDDGTFVSIDILTLKLYFIFSFFVFFNRMKNTIKWV